MKWMSAALLLAEMVSGDGQIQAKALLPIPDKLVVLTFDDSNKSDRFFVAEIVTEMGFGATFYVTEGLGFLKSKTNYTTWEEIRELHDMGFEIGNHTQRHRNVTSLSGEDLERSLTHIDRRCAEYGIPKPTTFCFPGFSHGMAAVEVIDRHGFQFARRGVRPEFSDGGQGGRGPAYDPEVDHPLLVPTTWYSGPQSGFEDLKWAVNQARDGKIAVLCYHGVPAIEHPWVSTPEENFIRHMRYLRSQGCQVIAMRDLSKYVDPGSRVEDPYAVIGTRTPIALADRRELFVDDHVIETMSGSAELQLHRPEPQEIVLVTDQPWEGNTSAYYTIFQDDDRYRMYYRGSHFDEGSKEAGHREVTCYAESTDGIQWTKPSLGLVEFDGSKANNIVWDGIGTHCFTVFKDPNPACPPEARYKALSRGRPKARKGLYVFQSPDGIHWSMIRRDPVITDGAFDSQNLAFWDATAGIYREFHRTFDEGIRAIMTGTSKDFVEWSKPEMVTYDGGPSQHLYTNAVLPHPEAPHLLLGFPTRYLPDEGQRVEPTFMTSRDGGRSFHRWFEAIIPEWAPEDRSGNRSNYMAWGLLTLPQQPDEMSVYATEAYYTGPDSRLRRFTYRKDGFVSLRVGREGELRTRSISFQGNQLAINAKVDPGGSVRVELQDWNGEPLPGYRLADCEAFTMDSIKHLVHWEGRADVSALAGMPIRLRFQLKHADLFTFQFQR